MKGILILLSTTALFHVISCWQLDRIYWLSQNCDGDCPLPINFTGIIPSGFDEGASTDSFLARYREKDGIYNAKAVKKSGIFYVGMNGREVTRYQKDWKNADLLVYPPGVLQWIPAEGSKVPIQDMVPVGYLKGSKETIYSCRAIISGRWLISGRFMESEGDCVVPVKNKEINIRKHEVLVLSPYGKMIGAVIPAVKKD